MRNDTENILKIKKKKPRIIKHKNPKILKNIFKKITKPKNKTEGTTNMNTVLQVK